VRQRSPENPSNQVKLVRECCRVIGVPRNLRSLIWGVMLGIKRKSRTHEQLPEEILSPLFNQRTIALDVERTRPTVPPFKDPEVRKSMELVLTEYCRRRHISYIQGMNYVLSPFYLLELADSDEIYIYFDAFVRIFLPNTFTDTEFGALQCIFRLFKLLLQYHDPELSSFLDQHNTPPELYATPWFVTMWAQKCEIDTLLHLWDELLLDLNPMFHYFVSLELVRYRKENIMKCCVDELPGVMSSITIPNKNQMKMLFFEARKTRLSTPNSFHELFYKCITQKVVVDGALYTELLDLQALAIEPKELIEQFYDDKMDNKEGSSENRRRRSRKLSKIKHFVIDCRPIEQYEAGHLPYAFHLDPALNSESLKVKMDSILTMKGFAFCLFFDGVPSKLTNIDNSSHLNIFLNKRIKSVSVCRGGYYAIHQMFVSGEITLVDHDNTQCLECAGWKKNLTSKGNFASYMKKFYNAAETFKRNNQNRLESGIPRTVIVLPQTVDLRLIMTVLRDKNASKELYQRAANRLLSVLVAATLEKNNISQLQIDTATSFSYNGYQTVKSIYGVALDEPAQNCLEEVLMVYQLVARTVVGHLRIEEKIKQEENGRSQNIRSAVAFTPRDIEDRQVILFNPVLGSRNDIHSAIEALFQLGTKDLTILTIVASRPTLWVLLDKFPNIQIVCAAVDSFAKGRVFPGIGVFSERYTTTKAFKTSLDLVTTILGNYDSTTFGKNDCAEEGELKNIREGPEAKAVLSIYTNHERDSMSSNFVNKNEEDLSDLLKG
jgi:uracil phosphoribosyltransferase/rhodanese-related sulfurtransferase